LAAHPSRLREEGSAGLSRRRRADHNEHRHV